MLTSICTGSRAALRLLEDLALALLHRLRRRRGARGGVGLLEGAARGLGVARVGGVEAGRVEDLDARERRERQEDLDAADLARRRATSARRAGRAPSAMRSGGSAPTANEDARDRVGGLAQVVERRGRREDAGRRDFGADERVDEGALAGVELADDGEAQRARGAPRRGRRPRRSSRGRGGRARLARGARGASPSAPRPRPGPTRARARRRSTAPQATRAGGERRELVEERLATLACSAAAEARPTDAARRGARRRRAVPGVARPERLDGHRERGGVAVVERRVEQRARGSAPPPRAPRPGAPRAPRRGALRRARTPPATARAPLLRARRRPIARAPASLRRSASAERRRERLARAGRVEDHRAQERREALRVAAHRQRAPPREVRAPVGRADLDPLELACAPSASPRASRASARRSATSAALSSTTRSSHSSARSASPCARSRSASSSSASRRASPPGSATASARTKASRTSVRGAPGRGARAREAHPDLGARRGALRELLERQRELGVEPRHLARVGEEREPEGRVGHAREDPCAAARARIGSPRASASSPSRRGISAPARTTSTRPSQRPMVSARRTGTDAKAKSLIQQSSRAFAPERRAGRDASGPRRPLRGSFFVDARRRSLLVLAPGRGRALAGARPPECAPLTAATASNVWERAKYPALRRYCDLLASGAAKLASASGAGPDQSERRTRRSPTRTKRRARSPATPLRPSFAAARSSVLGQFPEAVAAMEQAHGGRSRGARRSGGALCLGAGAGRGSGGSADAEAAVRALLPRASALPPAERGRAELEAALLAQARGSAGLDQAIALFRLAHRDAQDALQEVAAMALSLALDRGGEREESRVPEAGRRDPREVIRDAARPRRARRRGRARGARRARRLCDRGSRSGRRARGVGEYLDGGGGKGPWAEHARAAATCGRGLDEARLARGCRRARPRARDVRARDSRRHPDEWLGRGRRPGCGGAFRAPRPCPARSS